LLCYLLLRKIAFPGLANSPLPSFSFPLLSLPCFPLPPVFRTDVMMLPKRAGSRRGPIDGFFYPPVTSRFFLNAEFPLSPSANSHGKSTSRVNAFVVIRDSAAPKISRCFFSKRFCVRAAWQSTSTVLPPRKADFLLLWFRDFFEFV